LSPRSALPPNDGRGALRQQFKLNQIIVIFIEAKTVEISSVIHNAAYIKMRESLNRSG